MRSGRRLGDIHTPPPSFSRELKKIGDELSVHWNRVRCIWQVWGWSKGLGKEVIVLHVQGPDEGHLPLDDRSLLALKRASRGYDYLKELEDEMRESDEEYDRDVARDTEDFAREELLPRVQHDLNTEVSNPKAPVSIGSVNIPKEDVRAGLRNRIPRYRFGAAPADVEIEVEV